MIPYPSSSVWYIRVSSKGETGQGCGVGVRLRKKGQPGTEATYILTCAHVVRCTGKDGKELGARHENIRVYPAGYGYDEMDGIQVEPVMSVAPLKTFAVGTFYNQPVEDIEYADWALLAFTEPKWTNSRTSHSLARRWHLPNPEQGDQCVISGYPDGKAGFSGHDNGNDNIVRPKPCYAIQTIEKVVDNVITFDGTHSRSGMSGGGVFRKDGENYSLCGLHRARYDERLQLKAVSIQSILLRLDELGYEPAMYSPGPLGETFSEFNDIWHMRPEGVKWREAFVKAKPASSQFDLPVEDTGEQEQALCAINYLSELGPDQGVLPLFRFAYQLKESLVDDGPFTSRLTTWLQKRCSGGQLVQLQDSLSMDASGKPRIVIQMTRPSGDGMLDATATGSATAETAKDNPDPAPAAYTPAAHRFHYTTWFLGFPKTPPPEECVGTRDNFKRVLEHAWSTVRDLYDHRSVLVELFIPKQLFSWAVETQQVRIASFPHALGTQHHFALRYDRKVAGQLLKSRMAMAESRSQEINKPIRLTCDLTIDAVPEDSALADDHFAVSVNCGIDPADLHLKLEAKNRILGVLWESMPDAPNDEDGDGDPDVWDAAVESGVPLIMWLREAPPDANDEADLRKLFQHTEWESLPNAIQHLRRAAAQKEHKDVWHTGRHLAVILDHPKRPLPPASRVARLRSPGSRIN